MAVPSKPNRQVFLAMEELGLTGWLPGSARRVPVRTSSREALGPAATASLRNVVHPSDERDAALTRRHDATRTMAWLVVTAIGAVTAVSLASLFGRRR